MQLISDWRRVAAVSLSWWLTVAGLFVLIVPEVLYALTGVDIDPALLWWTGVLLILGSLVGRLIRQDLPRWREFLRWTGVAAVLFALAFVLAGQVRAAPVAEQDTLKIAIPFIAQEEGMRLEAYLDVAGVATICAGSTRGVRLGMKKTEAECMALLRHEVAEYRHGLHAYFNDKTKHHRLTPERDTAYTSLAFNAGIWAIGRSTATRRLNAGNIAGGCQALTWWNKAGGRVIRGLVKRRAREHRLCMTGL